jgi:XTP/dITP diphosphohydrolase
MIPRRVVLATANAGKIAELGPLVAEWGGVTVRTLAHHPGVMLPVESGHTYAENAIVKACAVARAVGLPALADDSGLEVDALGGAPGVHSARYAGPDDAARVAKLLGELASVPAKRRTARFCCVVALAWPEGRLETATGECAGRIATAPHGAGGFGYDPIFVADELGETLAAVAPADKQRVSHRARAVRALGARLGAVNART